MATTTVYFPRNFFSLWIMVVRSGGEIFRGHPYFDEKRIINSLAYKVLPMLRHHDSLSMLGFWKDTQ
jgi:hypothetical protein